jgi:hypothetical protein
MRVTPSVVEAEHDWVAGRADVVVPLINDTRDALGEVFGTDVDHVTARQYGETIDAVFADGDRAVNVAALARLLRELDVAGDYPGFVVDELLGRELAGTIAGPQPLRLLGEATFHYADVHTGEGRANGDGRGSAGPPDRDTAGADDLDAALAAGVQTRLPGWDWRETESPFDVE